MNNIQKFTLDFNNIKFSKINGEQIDDLITYILNYLKICNSNSIKISIGCDSSNKKEYTLYIFTVSFYDTVLMNGAHYIKSSYSQKRIKDNWIRLYNEALYLKDLGNYIEDNLKDIYKPNNNKKIVDVHLDLNPSPRTALKITNKVNKLKNRTPRKYSDNKSYSVHGSGVDLLESDGFNVITKPYAYASSSAADKHT